MHYQIIKAEQNHIPNIISIFNEVYNEAVQVNPLVPQINKDDFLTNIFRDWFNTGLGFVAIMDDRIVGYMIGLPVKKFFGSADGIYIPLLKGVLNLINRVGGR